MATIKKVYADVAKTTQLYPQTHEKAVVDDNGTTLESKLGAVTDLVNQKQMEMGAVPIDITPTEGHTTHVVSSDGVASAIAGVRTDFFTGEEIGDVSIFDDMSDLTGKTDVERAKMIPSGKSLTSEETTSPARSGYYNVGYGTTKFISVTNRVTVALPLDILSCKIVSVASGYRAAIQQWNVEDPTLPITDVTGTRVSDSGWKTSAYEESKLSSANYVVFTMSKSNDGNISASEAYANIVLSYSRVFNKIDDLTSKVSGLDDTVFGTDTVTIENNENSSSSRWAPYTAGNTQRGCYWLVLSNYKYQSYQVTFSIASGAPIQVGGSVRNSSNPTGVMAYDSGWILPGNSHTFTNAVDSDDAGYAICFNTTYVSSTSQATTFAEFLQYCTFSVEFFSSANGLVESVDILSRKKCLLATSNVKMVAHRGFHLVNVPENSLDAYRWAGFLGYDYVETDFCPTSDDELVLMHDASINRTMRNADYTTISGTVNVNSKTLAQLRANYVLASDDPRYRRPIPTLEEYFITCKESGLFAMPEIKQTGTTQAHVLAAYNMGLEIMGKGHFGFCSFSYALLDYARTLDDDLELWYIGSSILGTTNSIKGDSRETASTVWYPSYTGYSLSASLVKQYHAKGMRVAVWTVPVSECDNMIKTGVDYIATDYIGANLSKTDGRVYDESDMATDGVHDTGITLTSGQAAVVNDRMMQIGMYYISIIAKGPYTLTAPNLSVNINDADFTRRVFKGIADNKSGNMTITARGNVEIQFVNVKIVEVE